MRLLAAFFIGMFALVACAPLPIARHTQPASTSTRSPSSLTQADYHGDRLVVDLTYPAERRSQLAPLSLHYVTLFAFLANYSLPPFCHSTPESLSCSWSSIGTFPSGGMVVTFGTEGYGPIGGSVEKDQILGQGTPTSIDGRRAAEQSGQEPLPTPG